MKKVLMFMSVFMIGSQIRPENNIMPTALIGVGAYIATSMLVTAVINEYTSGTESTPITPKTSIPSTLAAMAAVMAYEGEKGMSVFCGFGALATAIAATVHAPKACY